MSERPILVVDDDPALLDVVAETLRDEGFPVSTAGDGATALRRVDEERPSLVLLDMRMPRIDGWEFARRLGERGIQLPIVVMTAAADAAGWAAEIGANGYLAKPFGIGELIDAVQAYRSPGAA
ncbi:MAG TPA: response regulator [Candidatus Limnocylindria bacterium]|jgi:CheY-like chemotaxis protein|nr:response regulator [Candidatus Limnocylindria bacterium]